MSTIAIQVYRTPNPLTLKFETGNTLLSRGQTQSFARDSQHIPTPLKAILDLPGVVSLMVGESFVSVTRDPGADWDEVLPSLNWQSLTESVVQVLKLELSQATLPFNLPKWGESSDWAGAETSGSSDDEISRKIQTIIDEEIRPAVAMDGGDIVFDRYERGVLFVRMKGACSGCPSSTLTLRMGIENRLKEDIPDLVQVVPV
jgi:Fe-S cluster biogenesis protein NfuA